ncbi:MAG: helix-turn-helix domain-containing protein [Acetatifactor sp.]|nr:helix-turn-helix domain-containing protein [Acetatifactor sp.]
MILAEKIAYLRKQKEWSQEELADRLEISRQSVSKWESGASIPELDKIIGMSHIFGVSTDFLLKDEYDIDVISKTGQDAEAAEGAFLADSQGENAGCREVRSISLEEANIYLQTVQKTAGFIAIGVSICILSPICLLVMAGWSEYGPVAISESIAMGLGVTILLAMVAVAVVLFIINGMKLESYEYLEKEEIHLQYGVSGIVEKKKEAYAQRYQRNLVLGVILCILSVLPLMIAAGLNAADIWLVYSTCLLLAIVSVGVFLLVQVGNIWESFQKLLQEGDYSVEKKQNRKKFGPLVGAYWCLVTAIYLGISFCNSSWGTTWLIWPVAALLFVVVLGIFRVASQSRDRS